MISNPTIRDSGANHRIFVVVENCQDEHQGILVEVTGMLYDISNSIFFDSGALDSFISLSLVQ